MGWCRLEKDFWEGGQAYCTRGLSILLGLLVYSLIEEDYNRGIRKSVISGNRHLAGHTFWKRDTQQVTAESHITFNKMFVSRETSLPN
jgi:hypothetical protein